MQVQTADVIDFEAYRQLRGKSSRDAGKAVAPAMFSMKPVFMWMPYWGFIPVMAMGVPGQMSVPGHGV